MDRARRPALEQPDEFERLVFPFLKG